MWFTVAVSYTTFDSFFFFWLPCETFIRIISSLKDNCDTNKHN